jgi:hypothetical protein
VQNHASNISPKIHHCPNSPGMNLHTVYGRNEQVLKLLMNTINIQTIKQKTTGGQHNKPNSSSVTLLSGCLQIF